MVDALRESWRVLSANGVVMDLRPLALTARPVEVVTEEEAIQVGELDDAGTVADDVAADRAVAQVVQEGWLLLREDARFDFDFYWDTVGEMASFIEDSRRMKLVSPSYEDLERIQREWCAKAGGRVRLRYSRTMMLAVYQKATNRRVSTRD
jgi:hypothetical protein